MKLNIKFLTLGLLLAAIAWLVGWSPLGSSIEAQLAVNQLSDDVATYSLARSVPTIFSATTTVSGTFSVICLILSFLRRKPTQPQA